MIRSIPLVGALVTSALFASLASACDGSDGSATSSPPVSTLALDPVGQFDRPDFCDALADLDRRTDVTIDEIVAAYQGILDQLPGEVAIDVQSVIDQLQAGVDLTPVAEVEAVTSVPDLATAGDARATPSTSDSTAPGATRPPDVFEEGYDPDDTPAARFGTYRATACNNTVNNPGPAATQPDGPPDSSA